MKKAAVEIPEDYHAGLKKAAVEEEGDLSNFVLEAMLENYAAAKEDGVTRSSIKNPLGGA